MLDNNTMLKLNDRTIFSDRPLLGMAHAILVVDYDWWPCGTPVVLDKSLMEIEELPVIKAYTLFPPRANIDMRNDTLTLPKENFELTKLRPLVRRHRNLEIEVFEVTKMLRLNEYVKHYGGISFIVKEKKYRKMLAKHIKFMFSPFKYSSLFHYNAFDSKWLNGEDDDYLSVISFYNLPYCVPIFNTKRVDGMGVSYCQAVRKESIRTSNLLRTFRLDFVLSNYEENLFVIDGSVVNQISPVSEAHLRDIEKRAAEDLVVKDPKEVEKWMTEMKGKADNGLVYNPEWKEGGKIEGNQYGNVSIDVSEGSSLKFTTSTNYWNNTSSTSND